MNLAAAQATQRAIDEAMQPRPLTPLPEVIEWFGQAGLDQIDQAVRELERTTTATNLKGNPPCTTA